MLIFPPQVIGSTIGDRVAVNHCVTEAIAKKLGKKIYELNCNLHPLDGVAVGARKALSKLDKEESIPSSVFGYEGRATNLIHAVSKLRHK